MTEGSCGLCRRPARHLNRPEGRQMVKVLRKARGTYDGSPVCTRCFTRAKEIVTKMEQKGRGRNNNENAPNVPRDSREEINLSLRATKGTQAIPVLSMPHSQTTPTSPDHSAGTGNAPQLPQAPAGIAGGQQREMLSSSESLHRIETNLQTFTPPRPAQVPGEASSSDSPQVQRNTSSFESQSDNALNDPQVQMVEIVIEDVAETVEEETDHVTGSAAAPLPRNPRQRGVSPTSPLLVAINPAQAVQDIRNRSITPNPNNISRKRGG